MQSICYTLIHEQLRQFQWKLAGGPGWIRIPSLSPMPKDASERCALLPSKGLKRSIREALSGLRAVPGLKPTAACYYGIDARITEINSMKDGLQGVSGYITKTQVAARMQVTLRTIDSWMAKGLIPFRKIGRTVRFDWDEVCEYLIARDQRPITMPARNTGTGIAEMLRLRAAEIRRTTR
jgi:excisionase family DNA binding protein